MPAFQNGGVYLFIYLFIKPIQDRHGNMLNHLLAVVRKQLHTKCYKIYIRTFKCSIIILYLYMLYISQPYRYGITYFALTFLSRLLKMLINNINVTYIMLYQYVSRQTTCTILDFKLSPCSVCCMFPSG